MFLVNHSLHIKKGEIMGGRGSGNWYRWDKKGTFEEYKRLDIRQICKRKLLYPGNLLSCGWSIKGEPSGDILVAVKEEHLLLIYKARESGRDWKNVEQKVRIAWTKCHYGGSHPWFKCPGCGKRIAVLVAAGTYFLCRHCYNLNYSSQSETELDRMYRKARKIRARLGEEEWLKPKGMHQKTFDQIRRQLNRAERMADMAFAIMGAKKFGITFEDLV